MLILGLETSCDDTGVALYDSERGILAEALHSQVAMHARYGGVVPELASRDHLARLSPMILQCLKSAALKPKDLDAIAWTRGPGLAGALLVGASVGSALALSLDVPGLGIHHLEGHLLSPLLDENPPQFPFVALLCSGGHTQLMLVRGLGCYDMLGDTLDDAAGEAFDKCAKMLGLAYPGGPLLDSLSKGGDPHAHTWPFARVGLDSYSFSGLKTSVLYYLQKHPISTDSLAGDPRLADLCASVRYHIVESLLRPLRHWRDALKPRSLALVGGVAANSLLRQRMLEMGGLYGLKVWIPPTRYCTDNAAMIAASARVLMDAGWHQPLALHERPLARWPLQEYLVETGGLNQAPVPGS